MRDSQLAFITGVLMLIHADLRGGLIGIFINIVAICFFVMAYYVRKDGG
jgi:hypothetical protein